MLSVNARLIFKKSLKSYRHLSTPLSTMLITLLFLRNCLNLTAVYPDDCSHVGKDTISKKLWGIHRKISLIKTASIFQN